MPDFIDLESLTVEQQQAFRDYIKTPWAMGTNNVRATFFDDLPIGEQIIIGLDVDGEFNQAVVIPFNEPGGVPQINNEGVIPARVSVVGGTYAELQDTIFPKNELVIEWSGDTALNLRVGDGITPGGQVLATRPHSITGNAYQNQTLTSEVAKQWLLNGEPIDEETGNTLTVPESVVLGDVISQEGSVAVPVIRIPDSCGIKVDTTKPGSASNRMVIPARNVSTYDCRVYWGDGNYSDVTTYNDAGLTHDYDTPGEYDIQISGTFRAFYFNNTGDRQKLIGVDQLGNTGWGVGQQVAFRGCNNLQYFNGTTEWSHVEIFIDAWSGCSSLTSFPLLDVSSGTNFIDAWSNCSSLTEFPELDVSSGTNFTLAWSGCSSLTEFPELDVSSGTNFTSAWSNCSSLTEFPELDVSSGTNFSGAWLFCTGLASFPELDVSSGTNFSYAWSNCSSLTSFKTRTFNSLTNGSNCFLNSTLSTEDWSAILVYVEANNPRNTATTFHGGNSKHNSAGAAAKLALEGRNWTIVDGGPE